MRLLQKLLKFYQILGIVLRITITWRMSNKVSITSYKNSRDSMPLPTYAFNADWEHRTTTDLRQTNGTTFDLYWRISIQMYLNRFIVFKWTF